MARFSLEEAFRPLGLESVTFENAICSFIRIIRRGLIGTFAPREASSYPGYPPLASVREESAVSEEDPVGLKRFLLRLGRPQFAFIRNIPKPTRFYYFRCQRCKRIYTDYVHGYSRYFICPQCDRLVAPESKS